MKKLYCIPFALLFIACSQVTKIKGNNSHTHVKTSFQTISIQSALDGTVQEILTLQGSKGKEAPLVIFLHGWNQRFNSEDSRIVGNLVRHNGWSFISPDFRGVFDHPKALLSKEVFQDLDEAFKWAKDSLEFDADKVYLLGISGGASTAIGWLGKNRPHVHAVSLWNPIVDFNIWMQDLDTNKWDYSKKIKQIIEYQNPDLWKEQLHSRSPIRYLDSFPEIPIFINAGSRDGFDGPVSPWHSLKFFLQLSKNKACNSSLSPLLLDSLKNYKGPFNLIPNSRRPKAILSWKPTWYEKCGFVEICLFQGGHIYKAEAALAWFQNLKRKSNN